MPILTEENQREELERCMMGWEGEWYWMRKYAFSFDKPRKRVAGIPNWAYLRDYVKLLYEAQMSLEPREEIVEKSRDMMVTIVTALHMLHAVQFVPDWSGFVISQKEDYVDDGGPDSTPDSVFGIVRFGWEHEPAWLRPRIDFRYLRVTNEEGTNSYIRGESMHPNAGRGKSVTFKWGDEFAFCPKSESVHAAMSGGGYSLLLYTSTSNLAGGAFHRLRTDPDSGFHVTTLKWFLRPDRTQAWYERKKQMLSPMDFAREVEIEYEFRTPMHVYQRWAFSTHTLAERALPARGRVIMAFDEGWSAPGAFYVIREVDGVLCFVDEVYETHVHVDWKKTAQADLEQKARFLLGLVEEDPGCDTDWRTVALVAAEKHGVRPQDVLMVLGPEGRTAEGVFAGAGFQVFMASKDRKGRIRAADRRMVVSPETQKPGLIVGRNCEKLIWELGRYMYRMEGGVVTEEPSARNDHGCDCLACVVEAVDGLAVVETQAGPVSEIDDGWKTEGRL